MRTFGDRLLASRKEKRLSQKALGDLVGMSQSNISELENDVSESSGLTVQLARALGVRPAWLATGRGPKTDGSQNTSMGPEIQGKVPLISMVAASDFADVVDNFAPGHAEEYVETTVPIHRHTYALRVDGPSMTNPSGQEPTFPHDSRIVVEPNLIDRPENLVNRFVIVRRHGEDTATFKQLIRDGGRFLLHPLNPQFDNIPLVEGDVSCGVVREKPVRYV